MKTSLLAVGALFFCFCAFSQNSSDTLLRITAEDAVRMAITYNMPLKMSAIDVNLSETYKDSRWNNYMPSLYGSAELQRGGTLALPEKNVIDNSEKNKWSWGASIGASFSLSSASFSESDELLRSYQSSLIVHQDNTKRLETDVKIAFYQLIAMQEDKKIAQADLDRANAKFVQDERNYRDGITSESEMLRSQVSLENAKSELAIKQYDKESALAEFRDLLGIDRDKTLHLEGTIEVTVETLDANELIAKHLYNRSDIQIALIDLARLEAEKRDLALSDFTPTLQAEYAFLYGESLFEQNDLTDSASLSLSLRIPLDSYIPGTKSKNRYVDVAAQIEKQEIHLQRVIKDAENDVFNMVRQLERSKSLLQTLIATKDIAERSYSITYASYMRGEIPYYSNVSDVESDLDTARVRVLAEQYNYLSLLLNLEYALNLPE